MKSMERCEGMQQSVRGGQKKILIMLCPGIFYTGHFVCAKRKRRNKKYRTKIFERFSVTFLRSVRLISEKGGKERTDEY